MPSFNSCFQCVAPKRHPGCHGHCPEYLEEKAEYNRKKEAYDRERSIGIGIYCSRTEQVMKAMKYRRHKKT